MLEHRNLKTIHLIMEQQDHDGIMKTAHACKGSCRPVGTTSLAEGSAELLGDGMCRKGKLERATEVLERWIVGQNRTRQALEQERDSFSYPPECVKHEPDR